jgi:hypothetical protein
MKLTQTIKNWLHKLFAWWPWKESTPFEYSNAGNPVNKGMMPDTLSRSTIDGIATQTGNVPRLSTIGEWPERVVKSDFPAVDEFSEPRSLSSTPSGDGETIPDAQSSPTPLQRLEFLRFLIKRGIVNEGFEEDE